MMSTLGTYEILKLHERKPRKKKRGLRNKPKKSTGQYRIPVAHFLKSLLKILYSLKIGANIIEEPEET